ncbi:MAG TPA: hypothetical protein V6C57_26330 [Coleofasciculaceae cyanobacterium]
MAEFLEVSAELAQPLRQPNPWIDFAEVLPCNAFQRKGLRVDQVEWDSCASTYIRLDMEDLPCFATVEKQFEQWDVVFANAIAIRPSNPAYPPHSGITVLMGAPKDGYLEASFLRPAHFVSGFVTSSRRTVLTAFDQENRVIASTETPGANLATSESAQANMQLSIRAAKIHRVTFHAFDGQLTLDDFCFCLE